MQAVIASVSLLLLLHTCTEVTAVKQKRFGIELCKRHCAKYNRCYGIRYNITSITCTILNDRHTDGDDMHVSRRNILESLRPQADCVASQYYRTRLCIVNNKGHTIDITETRMSMKEDIKETGPLNISSTHNLMCRQLQKDFPAVTCYIPDRTGSHADEFGALIEKDFLPGRRYLTHIKFGDKHYRTSSQISLLTLSVTNATHIDSSRMPWIIYQH